MIYVRQVGATLLVRPAVHRLDAVTGQQVVSQLRDHLVAGGKILLNLADVCYLNSEALGYITMCCRRARHYRGGISVCCLQDGPKGVFRLMRIGELLDGVFDTEDEALAALGCPEETRAGNPQAASRQAQGLE